MKPMKRKEEGDSHYSKTNVEGIHARSWIYSLMIRIRKACQLASSDLLIRLIYYIGLIRIWVALEECCKLTYAMPQLKFI